MQNQDNTNKLDKLYSKYVAALADNGIHDSIIRGEGKKNSILALIGEAPGGEEEKQGKPFVGAAGKNLNAFLELLEIKRDDIYITNVVKFRPKSVSPKTGKPINRTPTKAEIELCSPFLFEELKIMEPSVIVTLGNVALKAVTGDDSVKIGEFHGKLLELSGLLIFPLYHPASVIYNRSLNELYEQDILTLKAFIGKETLE